VIIVNMQSFPGTRDEAAKSLRAILGLPERHDEDHEYSLAIVDHQAGAAIELTQFEAPCPENIRAHLVRLLEVLRETADEIQAAHADVLTEGDQPASTPTADAPSGMPRRFCDSAELHEPHRWVTDTGNEYAPSGMETVQCPGIRNHADIQDEG
jgi:hypothetical protein